MKALGTNLENKDADENEFDYYCIRERAIEYANENLPVMDYGNTAAYFCVVRL